MKEFLSVFTGIICCVQLAQAQPYKPLLDDFNEWHFTTCFSGCNTDVYFTDGDTIVDGKNCKILDGYHYISRTFLLLEDTAARQVSLLKINPTKTDEFLLYDFSKNEGDTMELFNPNSPFMQAPGFFRLDSIRLHPLEDGVSYRHFYWSPAAGNTTYNARPVWVEGVGSLSLINGAGAQPDFNGAGQLNCFFKNSEAFYVDLDSIQECEPVHVLGWKEKKQVDWRIYPNPLSSELQLDQQLSGQTYQIRSNQGHVVLNGRLNNTTTIFIEPLAAGHYILEIDVRKIPFIKQ